MPTHRRTPPAHWLILLILHHSLDPLPVKVVLGSGRDYLCPDARPNNCSCQQNDDQLGNPGWSESCFDNSSCLLYKIEFFSQGQFHVWCNKSVPFKKAMFSQYRGYDKVTNFYFDTCPLPLNVSLPDLFNGTTVQVLQFNCNYCHPNDIFPDNLLRGMSSLQELEITEYSFRELPADTFVDLINLNHLTLDSNNLIALDRTLFGRLTLLEHLSLFGNHLESLPEGLFENLTSLQVLYLSQNSLTTIGESYFAPLISLQLLLLQVNMIRNISGKVFQRNRNLTTLDMSSNSDLAAVPEDLLQNNGKLTDINLSNCSINTIPHTLFSASVNLINLNLNQNQIANISSYSFLALSKLDSLSLKHNLITELPENIFVNMENLQTLSLDYNRFERFPEKAFIDLVGLSTLNFEGNMLTELSSPDNSLPNLKELYLKSNNISSLKGYQPFGNRFFLTTIDLSDNQIEDISLINWSCYGNLSSVNFQNNRIKKLNVPTLNTDNTHIELQNNNITLITVDEIQLSESLIRDRNSEYGKHFFDVTSNPLNCDCHLLPFRNYIKKPGKKLAEFTDVDDILCNVPDVPYIPSPQSLNSLNKTYFVCLINESCPNNCRCFIRDNTTEMDCHGNKMAALPSIAPYNTTILWFQNNSLTSLTGLNASLWENLSTLYINDNMLTSVACALPPKLRNLYMTGNQIASVPDCFLQWATTAEGITLSGNNWSCACDGLNLKRLLNNHYKIVPDRNQVACASPKQLINQPTTNINDGTFCPSIPPNDSKLAYILMICFCLIFGAAVTILCVIYYRNRRTIIAYVFMHYYKIFSVFFKESDLDEEKPFHAFVSYSSSDSQIVKDLVEELEKKQPSYRLCIHERDWLPGQLITWNIVSSVQNSRRTILILSKDFLKSIWFQLEFHIAYYQMLEDKVDRLIIIVNGDLPDKKDIDKDLQVLLSTKSYLLWNERFFWEKLKYALPHENKVVPAKRRPELQRPNSELLTKIEDKIMTLTRESVTTVSSRMEPESVELHECVSSIRDMSEA